MIDFKNIHIGKLIEKKVKETELELSRISGFLDCSEGDIDKMYDSESLDTYILLRWSKLLKYDFFRIYSQHILLYTSNQKNTESKKETSLPQFRKNIYTKEIVDFILDSLKSGEKTKQQIMEDYRIPKTTLYKWINKYDEDK